MEARTRREDVGIDGRSHGARTNSELAVAEDHEAWLARTRVILTPIAAPSIMGLSAS